jgi:DNA processing protein
MSELARAVFAATGEGATEPRTARTAMFQRFLATFDGAAYLRQLAADGIGWLPRGDAAFPPRLRAIHDPPPGLFLRGRGDPRLLGAPVVAIVGARSCTDYGAHVARSLARDLVAAGVVVVSGLARGVDGWAHRGALDSGGPTVAVLGCGVDRDYPRAHAALAAEIGRSGLIVSEYPPGVLPAPWRFPARNRIVAGLSQATLIVEARERSGALITADFALEEGRDVLAVPGEITSALSRGTNELIRLGAAPVTGVADVLEVLGIDPPEGPPAAPASASAAAVLSALDAGASTADEVARLSGLAPGTAAAALTELELAGVVESRAGVFRR